MHFLSMQPTPLKYRPIPVLMESFANTAEQIPERLESFSHLPL